MDLMDVPEAGASADPWGAGAVSKGDPWKSYGTPSAFACFCFEGDVFGTAFVRKCLTPT